MSERQGLYSDYDVLALQDEWDACTKEIVLKRLGPFKKCQTLSTGEQQMLKIISEHLVNDGREEITEWIISHIDEQVTSKLGEAQRKPESPPKKQLIIDGLKAIDQWSSQIHAHKFLKLDKQAQFELLSSLQKGLLAENGAWSQSWQKDLFKQLVSLVVEAYFSHPWVWSEIGYGGPAYPRGYVRVELGLTDPWEPKRSDKD